MRKRITALALSLALLCSTVPAFATETTTSPAQEAAEALYKLGLFNGTGTNEDGTPIFELDRTPNRQEAITMLVRLLGKEEEAKAGTWSTPFTDLAEWATPYVGYAYTNGLTNGTSETTFGSTDPVSATQYLTFVLRALGYEDGTDFQWYEAWVKSDELGLTSGQYTAETTDFTRGDVAVISQATLNTIPKGEAVLLIDKLKGIDAYDLTGTWKYIPESVSSIEREYVFAQDTFTQAVLSNNDEYYFVLKEGTYELSGSEHRFTITNFTNTTTSVMYTKSNENILGKNRSEGKPGSVSIKYLSKDSITIKGDLYIRISEPEITPKVKSKLDSLLLNSDIGTIIEEIGNAVDNISTSLEKMISASTYYMRSLSGNALAKVNETKLVNSAVAYLSAAKASVEKVDNLTISADGSTYESIHEKCEQIMTYLDELLPLTSADPTSLKLFTENLHLINVLITDTLALV